MFLVSLGSACCCQGLRGEVCGFVPIRGNKVVFSFALGPGRVLNTLWVQVSSLPVGASNEGCSTERVEEQSQEPHGRSRYGEGCWVSARRGGNDK